MLKIAYSPIYKLQLPDGHRFPMLKYELIPEQLLYEGTVTNDHFFAPKPLSEDIITATHTPQYFDRMKHLELTQKEMRRIGFPLTQQLFDRCITIAGGTIEACHWALKYDVAMNVAGGTHHAFTDRGEGFCLLNDQAMAANYLINTNLAKRILIIDLDVHQGNGTAEIFRQSRNQWQKGDNTEGGVFTFSMHGANNYPLHKEQSDLDIGLPDGVTDAFYLKVLKENLSLLMDEVQPDFAFFNAGVDVLETDKLGRLSLTMNGCAQRDKCVLEMCRKNNVPVEVSMGGGYSARVATIIEAHAQTYRLAQEIFF
ncbi:MAG: histone deacetylase [Saprospiraceae bacterium]|nr:histone deacetylase [Saprospiraceae bacterium]